MPKTLLISLVGATPAVLTETVYALAHQEEPAVPDRVIAITTSTGADLLKEKLFAEGHWEQLCNDLRSQGHDIEGKLKFGNTGDAIRVFPDSTGSRELDDIRSAEDNEAVAEFFMELIRGFTENDTYNLIVSIAGGRKTTSALLHSVMTLLGRVQDQVNHILIDDTWIFHPDFMYPGCKGEFKDRDTGEALSSSDAELNLVDVPFIPLRYLFQRDLEGPARGFVDLMNQIRTRTVNVDADLSVQLDTRAGGYNVNGQSVGLSANEFLLYLYFALRAKDRKPPLGSFAAMGEDLADLKEDCLDQDRKDWGHWAQSALRLDFDPKEDARKWCSSIRKKLKAAGFDSYQVDRLVPRGQHIAIDLPPENIGIDE